MVNLLDYRSNSDYDAVAQVQKIKITLTIPAGTYSHKYSTQITAASPSEDYFVTEIFKVSFMNQYVPASYLQVMIPNVRTSTGNPVRLFATYDRYNNGYRLRAAFSDSYVEESTFTLTDPITVTLWLHLSKMPF